MPIFTDGSAAPVTATITRASVTTTSAVVAAANAERRSLAMYNEGPAEVKVAYAATASATVYTTVIPVGGWLEVPVTYSNGKPRPYAGVVSAITELSGTASVLVTSF